MPASAMNAGKQTFPEGNTASPWVRGSLLVSVLFNICLAAVFIWFPFDRGICVDCDKTDQGVMPATQDPASETDLATQSPIDAFSPTSPENIDLVNGQYQDNIEKGTDASASDGSETMEMRQPPF